MMLRRPFLGASLAFSSASVLLAMVSIQLGRRLNHIGHPPPFDTFAQVMLALVVAGLLVALVGLARSRGKGLPLWAAEASALVVLGCCLLDV